MVADTDGLRARELMLPLFMGDDEELQELIRDHMILPYFFGDFHSLTYRKMQADFSFVFEKPAKDVSGIHTTASSVAKACDCRSQG